MSDNIAHCHVGQQLLQLAIERNGSVAYCYGRDDDGLYVDITVDIPYRGDKHDTNYLSYRERPGAQVWENNGHAGYEVLIRTLSELPQDREAEIAKDAQRVQDEQKKRRARGLSGAEIVAKLGDDLEETLEAMEQTADGVIITPGMPTFRLRQVLTCVDGDLQTCWSVTHKGRTYVAYPDHGKDLYSTMEAAEEAGMKTGYQRLDAHEGVV